MKAERSTEAQFNAARYFERLQTIRETARLTEAGQLLIESGFEIVTTGGTCTAWAKQLGGERYILITDGEGLDHHLAEGETTWLVGVYGNDELDDLEPVEAGSVEEAIESANLLGNVILTNGRLPAL